MLESVLAYARDKDDEKVAVTLKFSRSLKDCIWQIAKKENVSFSSIVVGALKSVCEEWNSGDCSIITKEKADMWRLLIQKQDEIKHYLADPVDNDGYEHRGFYLKKDIELNQQILDLLLDQIENLENLLGLDDEEKERNSQC